MRHPWEHVVGMGLGTVFANQLVKWDVKLKEDLEVMLNKAMDFLARLNSSAGKSLSSYFLFGVGTENSDSYLENRHHVGSAGSNKRIRKIVSTLVELYPSFSADISSVLLEFLVKALDSSKSAEVEFSNKEPEFSNFIWPRFQGLSRRMETCNPLVLKQRTRVLA